MKQIIKPIKLSELQRMASGGFGDLVKAVVDIDQDLLVVDAEMHADEEQFLLQHGSSQDSLWGINLYPTKYLGEDFIEFDSMINLRPAQGNRTRGISDPKIRERIIRLVKKMVVK